MSGSKIMDIQILDFRPLPDAKSLRAFVDVRIGNITLRDFRVMQDNGKPYIRAPHTTYKDHTGTLRFRQIVDLPDEVRGEVDTLILSEYYHRAMEDRNERRKEK